MKKRLFSFLLCLVMVCSLLPLPILAEDNVVNVTVETPQEGQLPADVKPAVSDSSITIYAYDWYENGEKMSQYWDTFKVGKVYKLVVVVSRSGGFDSSWKATVAGTAVKPELWNNNMNLRFSREFVVEGTKVLHIVSIDGVPAPKAGATAELLTEDLKISPGVVRQYGCKWYDSKRNEWTHQNFVMGGTYTFSQFFTLEEGYVILESEPVSGLVNGFLAAVDYFPDMDPPQLRVEYTFPKIPVQTFWISEVYVKITTPVDGQKPDMSPIAVEKDLAMAAAGCSVTKVEWMRKNPDTGILEDFSAGSTFTEGVEYAARVTVSANSAAGYKFINKLKDCWFNTGDDNGKATVYSSDTNECVIYQTWKAESAPDVPIYSGDIVITPPVAGKQPDYLPEFGEEFWTESKHTDVFRNGVMWSSEKGPLYSEDTFEEGVSYTVTILLNPRNGYIFYVNGYQHAHLSINGEMAGVQTEIDPKVNPIGWSATVTYTFPPTPPDPNPDTRVLIPAVELELALPAAGEHPDYALKVLSGECIPASESDIPEIQQELKGLEEMGLYHGVGWFDDQAQTVLSPLDVFVAGKTYQMELMVLAKEGYRFPEDVAVTVSGIVPTFAEVENTEQFSLLVVGAEYVAESAKTLSSIAVTTPPAKTEYTVGTGFDPAGMVVTATYSDQTTKEVTGYTVTPSGALTKNDTAVTISYTEGETTVTATVPITVKERVLETISVAAQPAKTEYKTGESFDPAGMVIMAWYDDQSTSAVGNFTWTPEGKLTEDVKTVTIRYTEGEITRTAEVAITVKAAEETNPFVDVTEQDYFYDAVLWAYYAEPQVTNGMDATHFGPADTVKRGQAVTFLWRAMGCPEPETTVNPFEDVKESSYYYKPVLWAVEKGITNGTDATHFTPDQTCSTAHIITFLYRTLGIGTNGWYEEAGAWAKGAGLLDGLSIEVAPGVFCPRCDVVLFLYRQLGK